MGGETTTKQMCCKDKHYCLSITHIIKHLLTVYLPSSWAFLKTDLWFVFYRQLFDEVFVFWPSRGGKHFQTFSFCLRDFCLACYTEPKQTSDLLSGILSTYLLALYTTPAFLHSLINWHFIAINVCKDHWPPKRIHGKISFHFRGKGADGSK